ncbi:MAG: hypothetical protein AB7E48_00420 [Deferribacterales bacterium]
METGLKETLVRELSAANPEYTPKDVITALKGNRECAFLTACEFADLVLEIFEESSLAKMFYSMRELKRSGGEKILPL